MSPIQNENPPFRLMSNENPFGPPPKAMDAIRKYSKQIHCYPGWVQTVLKEKLAKKNVVKPENVAVSAGSYELINLIIRFLVKRNEEILTFDNTFMAYSYSSKRNHRKCIEIEMGSHEFNLEDIIPQCNEKTKAIFFANPNNPTGTIVTHNALKSLLENISEKILVVVDEAYVEYVTDDAYPNSVKLQKEFSNLIILRTFSKIYGMAGIRMGYGIADENIVSKLESKRLLRSINILGEKAAEAALDDVEFLEKSASHNSIEKEFLYQNLIELGFNVVPSHANFLYLPFIDNDRKNDVHTFLENHGLQVCNMEFFGLEKSLRISIGTSEANKLVVENLKQFQG